MYIQGMMTGRQVADEYYQQQRSKPEPKILNLHLTENARKPGPTMTILY